MIPNVFRLLESVGGQKVILLLIFVTGVGFELTEHHVIGADLIAVAVARLVLLGKIKGLGESKESDQVR